MLIKNYNLVLLSLFFLGNLFLLFNPELLYAYVRIYLVMTLFITIILIIFKLKHIKLKVFLYDSIIKIHQELSLGSIHPLQYPKKQDDIKGFIEAVNQLIKYLNQTIKIAQEFNANVSHELKTPLTALKVDLEYFLDYKSLDNEISEKIRYFIEKVDNLESITSQMLFVSNNNITKLNSAMKRVLINDIVYEILDEKSAIIVNKKLQITTHISQAISLHGHKELLKHALANIIDNAIKYSYEKQGICITLKEKENAIYLLIKDKGIGISKKDMQFIFHPYYRGTGIKSDIIGYGLGLSLATWIFELHNAKIKIHSIPDKETTLLVKFDLY
ncbi:HAMP domain-containing histidine kinase [Sulfurimonas sp. SAG-AH-194-I05]|nr:HAMP domain-containing sensor histidine kinase [Sulfurimonas sp. SAG-AH-194-I05]MDF1875961.1 HAMP domain-containing histidine kinase [Sulfurimonas sp. SAG-AH-194-I05]